MGFIKKIMGSKLFQGIMKFMQSPLGGLLLNIGLSMVTGGMGGLLLKGLSSLPSFAGAGNLLSTFGSFASKFLGPAQSFISQSGLSSVAGFLGNTSNSTDLLSMAADLLKSRQAYPQTDPSTESIANHNLSQVFAHQQAQQILRQYAA